MFLDCPPSPEKRLRLLDTFTFSCHKDLACFNSCCRNKHLPLTPYDVLRLKNRLNLNSDDFLSKYTVYRLDPGSGFPVISLNMGDEPQKVCPFVTPEGCGVYSDRPTACRLFPLGRSSGIGKEGEGVKEFYFLLDIPGCLGTEEKQAWSIETWCDNQGLQPYTGINDLMLDIVFHPERGQKKTLNDSQLQKVMVACYNLDLFRDFVFNTNFLKIFEIDQETFLRIKKDDIALLKLGFSYLARVLFP